MLSTYCLRSCPVAPLRKVGSSLITLRSGTDPYNTSTHSQLSHFATGQSAALSSTDVIIENAHTLHLVSKRALFSSMAEGGSYNRGLSRNRESKGIPAPPVNQANHYSDQRCPGRLRLAASLSRPSLFCVLLQHRHSSPSARFDHLTQHFHARETQSRIELPNALELCEESTSLAQP